MRTLSEISKEWTRCICYRMGKQLPIYIKYVHRETGYQFRVKVYPDNKSYDFYTFTYCAIVPSSRCSYGAIFRSSEQEAVDYAINDFLKYKEEYSKLTKDDFKFLFKED